MIHTVGHGILVHTIGSLLAAAVLFPPITIGFDFAIAIVIGKPLRTVGVEVILDHGVFVKSCVRRTALLVASGGGSDAGRSLGLLLLALIVLDDLHDFISHGGAGEDFKWSKKRRRRC